MFTIWRLLGQFHIKAMEEEGLRDIAICAVPLHPRAWIRAPSAFEVPFNDLQY